MKIYERYRKRTARAYFSWLILGILGLHRFYVDWSWSGLSMLLMFMVGVVFFSIFIGKLILAALTLWWLCDLILLPMMIRKENERLKISL